MAQRLLILLLCLAGVAVVSACGRRGDLLTPYEAQVEAQREAEKEGETAPKPERPRLNRPFILDPLID